MNFPSTESEKWSTHWSPGDSIPPDKHNTVPYAHSSSGLLFMFHIHKRSADPNTLYTR